MDEVNPSATEHLETAIKQIGNEYLWVVIGLAIAFFSKELIMNFIKGVLVFLGSNIKNDDIIYISGRQARVVRKGFKSTVFYMTDRATKMIVPNEKLKDLTIERKLAVNGRPYIPKGGDSDWVPPSELSSVIDK
tara:strand:+ start:299 stop:700 length:402 start_codon:yes stop_codon:yes gene_type:complete